MSDFDEYPPAGVVYQREGEHDDRNPAFYGEGPGACPECGGRQGPLIVGEDYWMKCDAHEVCWCVGTRVTDAYKRASADGERAAIAALRDCEIVPADGVPWLGEEDAHARLQAALAPARKSLPGRARVSA